MDARNPNASTTSTGMKVSVAVGCTELEVEVEVEKLLSRTESSDWKMTRGVSTIQVRAVTIMCSVSRSRKPRRYLHTYIHTFIHTYIH